MKKCENGHVFDVPVKKVNEFGNPVSACPECGSKQIYYGDFDEITVSCPRCRVNVYTGLVKGYNIMKCPKCEYDMSQHIHRSP